MILLRRQCEESLSKKTETAASPPPEAGTVGETAFRRIRTDIISGALHPGPKLTLGRMKEQYDISVSTLREILNRLASEDFVVAEGQRGFEVAPATEAGL